MSYADLQSRAADMLSSKGQTVTIAGTTGGVYNPATDTVSGSAYSATAKAAMLPMTPYRQQKDTNIRAGDENMILAALDTTGAALTAPPLNAIVTLASGKTYTIISIDPLHPDGTDLIFDCAVRGNA